MMPGICTCMNCGCNNYPQIAEVHIQVHHILKKLLELLQCEVTASLIERQLEYLYCYLRMMPQAHVLADLPIVCKLLELMPEKAYDDEIYGEYYKRLLLLCTVPPQIFQPSEIFSCSRNLQEYFSVLGNLLIDLEEDCWKNIVLDALMIVLDEKMVWLPYFIKPSVLIKEAVSSDLPQIIGRLLTMSPCGVYDKLLIIANMLGGFSKSACIKMVDENAIDTVLVHLVITNGKSNPNVQICLHLYEESSKLLWLLLGSLDAGDDNGKLHPMPSQSALESLRHVLRYFYTKYPLKIDRNNVLAILLKILESFRETAFTRCGLAEDIIEMNIAVEICESTRLEWSKLQLTASPEDFTFVRLLLMFLPHFQKDEYYAGIRYIEKTPVVKLKLGILNDNQCIKWHNDHMEMLVCLVVNIFANLTVKEIMKMFIEENGPVRFVELLGVEQNIELNLTVLRSLISLTKNNSPHSKVIICHLLAVKADDRITEYCKFFFTKTQLDHKDQEVLSYSFKLIEILHKSKTSFASKKLTDMALDFLSIILKCDSIILPSFPIAIICFLWNIHLCDEENLNYFIRKDGIYRILDIAERCPWPVKIVALSLLTELSEERLTIPFLVTWRGTNSQTILPFLLDLFRQENEFLMVKQSTEGVITDVDSPLMGAEQRTILCDLANTLEDSPAISDMLASCRPKIYAILNMLEFVHADEVTKANEIYKMCNQKLSPKDQVTKILAENFFALKIAEIWSELNEHLQRTDVTPVDNDRDMLSVILCKAKNWAIFIQNKQNDVLKLNHENERMKENLLYMELREARLGQCLSAYSELEYIARCSQELFRIKTKKNINQHLMETKPKKTDRQSLYHTTFMYNIMVNPVFNQVLHMAYIKEDCEKKTKKIVEYKHSSNHDVISPSISSEKCLKEAILE